MKRLIARVVVAAGLAAAAYAAVPAAPAVAAGCATADGVTVVVDFHELGGGVQSACLPDGGGQKASGLFPAAGFPLDYVQRQPGFVCRVSGEPSDNPCVSTPPVDAYWGLWWSDGESGRWTYATTSASGLTVPDGGYVAFSWNGTDRSAPPGTTPSAHPAPAPTQEPTRQPGTQPSANPGQQPTRQPSTTSSDAPSGSASATAGSSAKPGKQRSRSASDSSKPSESDSASESASPGETTDDVVPASSEPPDAGDDGLPAWVAPVAVVVLFGAAGGIALVRRRRTGAG